MNWPKSTANRKTDRFSTAKSQKWKTPEEYSKNGGVNVSESVNKVS